MGQKDRSRHPPIKMPLVGQIQKKTSGTREIPETPGDLKFVVYNAEIIPAPDLTVGRTGHQR